MTELAETGRGAFESNRFDRAAHEGRSTARPLAPVQAELVAGAGAVLLLVSMLLLPWFGVDRPVGHLVVARAVASGTEGPWQALTMLRWLVLVTVVVAVVPLISRPAHRWLGLPKRTNEAVALLGGLTAVLLAYRVLIDLPDPSRVVDQQAGAILGLLGALVIALGGLESTRAHAARARAREVRRTRRQTVPPAALARVRA